MDKIQDEELLIKNMEGIEKECDDPNKYSNQFEHEVKPNQNNEEKKEDKKEEKQEENKQKQEIIQKRYKRIKSEI